MRKKDEVGVEKRAITVAIPKDIWGKLVTIQERESKRIDIKLHMVDIVERALREFVDNYKEK